MEYFCQQSVTLSRSNDYVWLICWWFKKKDKYNLPVKYFLLNVIRQCLQH